MYFQNTGFWRDSQKWVSRRVPRPRAGLNGRGARGNFYWRTPMT